MITHAILQVYKRDYLPKVKQLWHDMYDKILANKNDLFSRSLFIEIDSDFDGKLLKEELVSNFTGSFVHFNLHWYQKHIAIGTKVLSEHIFSVIERKSEENFVAENKGTKGRPKAAT